MNQQKTNEWISNDIPPFSDSKGGRYWLDDGMYSMMKLEEMFRHALKVMNRPLTITLSDCNEDDSYREVTLEISDSDCLVFPNISVVDAKRIYDDRSNGCCDFNSIALDDNGTPSVWLAGELCLDELVAVRTLVLAKFLQV